MPEPTFVDWNHIWDPDGDDTHAATDGADTFICRDFFTAKDGNNTITGFTRGQDRIDLQDVFSDEEMMVAVTFDDLAGKITEENGNTVIDLSAFTGGTITVEGVTGMTAADFHFLMEGFDHADTLSHAKRTRSRRRAPAGRGRPHRTPPATYDVPEQPPQESATMPNGNPQHRERAPATVSRRTQQALDRLAEEALEARRRGGLGTGHPEIDRRVFELTKITVAKIDRDPSLVEIGLDNIARWTRQKGGYLPACHAEWKALIEEHPWAKLRALLLEDSDEGQRLRSSHPFRGLVTEEERARILAT